jgi:hypothetical protein
MTLLASLAAAGELPPHEAVLACSAQLASACLDSSSDSSELLLLIQRHVASRRFDRLTFRNVLEKAEEEHLPLCLSLAWSLAEQGVLLFADEYLAPLDDTCSSLDSGDLLRSLAESLLARAAASASSHDRTASLQRLAAQLLSLAYTARIDAPGAPTTRALLRACGSFRLMDGVAQHWLTFLAACPALSPPVAWRGLFSSELTALLCSPDSPSDEDETDSAEPCPEHSAAAQLLSLLSSSLGESDALRLCIAAESGAGLRTMTALFSAHSALRSLLDERAEQALAACDDAALSATLRLAQAALGAHGAEEEGGAEPDEYAAWFTKLAQSAGASEARTTVLLNALAGRLHSDGPAALRCQAHALRGVKRCAEGASEYVTHSKRRRSLLLQSRPHGEIDSREAMLCADAPKCDKAEAEARAAVTDFIDAHLVVAGKLGALAHGFGRDWWFEGGVQKALICPQTLPPNESARLLLIKAVADADKSRALHLLPPDAEEQFTRRCIALREAGPAFVALHEASEAFVAAVLPSSAAPPSSQARAARSAAAAAALAALAPAAEEDASVIKAARLAVDCWQRATAAAGLASAFGAASTWPAAFVAAVAQWPQSLQSQLQTALLRSLRAEEASGHSAAVAQLSQLQGFAGSALLLARMAESRNGALNLSVLLVPDDCGGCPTAASRATAAACGYLHAASEAKRAGLRWRLVEDSDSAAEEGGFCLPVPRDLLCRMQWLLSLLDAVAGEGAQACAAALRRALLGFPSGPVPAELSRRLDAARLAF